MNRRGVKAIFYQLMTEHAETRVYVLGAGCSYDPLHGYPLAAQFIPELSTYGAAISDDKECAGIQEAVDYTV